MNRSITKYEELLKYNIDDLIKIATFNGLYNNDYYMSVKQLREALYSCLLADDILDIPDDVLS